MHGDSTRAYWLWNEVCVLRLGGGYMACWCARAGMTGDGARWCSVAWQSTGRNFDNKTRARRCARRRVVAKKLIITLQLGRLSLSRSWQLVVVRAARKRDFLALCFKTARF